MGQENQGMQNGQFKPCPDSPNCVSSTETRKRKNIKPIDYFGQTMDQAKEKLLAVCHDWTIEILKDDGDYLHVSFKTSSGAFIDDVEFFFPEGEHVIHLKSASRVGWWDFGANRRRLKKISKRFLK